MASELSRPRPDPLRRAAFEAGLYAVAAAGAYALLVVLLRETGAARVGAALCALLLIAVATGASRRAPAALRTARQRPALVAAAGLVLGLALAALGDAGRLLFLPALLLLATLGVAAGPRAALAGALPAAAGLLAPLVADFDAIEQRRLLVLSAAALLVVPPLLALLIARVGPAAAGLSPGSAAPLPSGDSERALLANGGAAAADAPQLTPRQREAVTFAAAGLRHAEIGERMGVSIHQVRRLLQQARERVHARTTRELVAWAMMQGIVAPAQGTETEARPSDD